MQKSVVVVVCCQTLSPDQVLEALIFAERLRVRTRFLVMFLRLAPISEFWGCLLMQAQEGPRAFERAVFHLLQGSFGERA